MKKNKYISKTILATVCVSLLIGIFANPANARGRLGLTGQVNPEFAGKQIRKMVVVAPNVVKYFRSQIERRMVAWLQKLSKGGTTGLRLGDVVSSFKKHNGSEVISILRKQQVDAVAVVDIKMDGGMYGYPRELEDQGMPKDMAGALEYSANLEYRPRFNGKYRTTNITVFDVKTGGVIWQGNGKVNATQDSRKWHKKSGVVLAKRFAKYMRKAKVLTHKKAAPEPEEVHEVTGTNYTSGDESDEPTTTKKQRIGPRR